MNTHFAEIDPNTKVVKRVIVATQEFIDSGKLGDPKNWLKTNKYDKGPIKNFAVKGGVYDEKLNAFIRPKPFTSWLLDEEKADWKAPKERPSVGLHFWNEKTKDWESITELDSLNN